jgi:hypothetical protein
MLPVIPLFMIVAGDVLDRLRGRAWAVVGGLAVLGVGIQLLGMANPISNYYVDLFRADLLYDYTNYVHEDWRWLAGNWTLEWAPITYHLEHFSIDRWDVAWRVADPQGPAVLLALTGVIVNAGIGIWLLRQQDAPRRLSLALLTIGALTPLAAYGVGVDSLRDDPRAVQEWPLVQDLAIDLDEQLTADDALLIDREQYTPIFMNYFKTPALVATLPYSPGEVYDAGGARVPPDSPIDDQLGGRTAYMIDWTAARHEDLWLVASSSPFEAEKRRPVERYLVMHHFPVLEISTDPQARAIRFDTTPAPLAEPTVELNADFGDSLRLVGYDLPTGDTFAPGDVLPLSLAWQATGPVDFDYNVGVFLLDAAGTVVIQRDGQPQATFGRTSAWEPGSLQRDNHGLLLPDDLLPGEYQLVVTLYNWQTGERLPVDAPNDLLPLATIRVTE